MLQNEKFQKEEIAKITEKISNLQDELLLMKKFEA